jgi:hypothetical protein
MGAPPAPGEKKAAQRWAGRLCRGAAGGRTAADGGLDYLRPAASRRMAALSVRSQVNSGSSRPKWP